MSQDFENKLIMTASLSGIVCFMVWFFSEPLARFMDVAVMGLLLAVGLALLFGVAFGLVGLWGYVGHVRHGWRMAHIEAVNTATFLLQGCERIELKVDRRHGNRKAMLGWRKAEQYECQVPTLFHDYPTVPSRQLVINSPSHYSNTEAKLARAVISLNGPASQTTKAEIYRLAGVTKGGKNRIIVSLTNYSSVNPVMV